MNLWTIVLGVIIAELIVSTVALLVKFLFGDDEPKKTDRIIIVCDEKAFENVSEQLSGDIKDALD